jgi:DNA repair photolyase
MLKIRETTCKTLLNKSGLADFTLNCYVGCSHRCLYCYARYMTKFKSRPEDWGDFVDVKINAPEALAKQLKKIKKPGEVFMSTVGDSWQPLETKYGLSRACLKLLLEAGFEVSILTKSSLIQRDFDLLEAYKTPRLGMTLTTLDIALQKALEPQASEPQERLDTLKKAREKGIKTWAFLGPLIPEITDTRANLEALFRGLRGLGLSNIYVDRLNLRWGVLEALKRGLSREGHPELRTMLYKATNPAKYAEYTRKLRETATDLARQTGLSAKLNLCF